MIYLDYASTTPVEECIINKISEELRDNFGNPSSKHYYGQKAKDAIEKARCEIALTIGALPEEIYFTSGATESNNLILKAFDCDCDLACSSIEHKSILEPIKNYNYNLLNVNNDCLVDLNYLEDLLNDKHLNLVSSIFINNETGVISPIEEIFSLCKEYNDNIITHTDATQAFGKIPIDVKEMNIDSLSLSGHKIYSLKGCGALYLSNEIDKSDINSFIEGGSQENGLRSGTQNVIGIIALGEAARIAREKMNSDWQKAMWLEDILYSDLSLIDCIHFNGCLENKCPWILNVSFEGCKNNEIISAISDEFALSKSSACASEEDKASHVLEAMGLEPELCLGAIRISWGRQTTESQIRKLGARLRALVDEFKNY